MITVKRLKELIEDLPDDAKLYAYEGEDTGIVISNGEKSWFIRAKEISKYDEMDTYIEGFKIKD